MVYDSTIMTKHIVFHIHHQNREEQQNSLMQQQEKDFPPSSFSTMKKAHEKQNVSLELLGPENTHKPTQPKHPQTHTTTEEKIGLQNVSTNSFKTAFESCWMLPP